jgi:sugar-specific transcriptional regulator TrmB
MITGEERIRELLGQLYGAVNGYEGRPAQYQAARAESLAHELQDVIDNFQKLTQQELPAVNAALKKKKAQPVTVLSEAGWRRKRESEGSSGAAAGLRAFGNQAREID